ncbi:MAG: cytochrome c [Gemmatimonadota bacterium]|nr:cytochrome c [Gemmatimonadota bacterium]
MSAFAKLDREVHDAAVRVREAAEAEDLDGVVEAWQAIQDGCVACHRRFRDRLKPVLSGRISAGN